MESTTWTCKQKPDELIEWIHGRMVGTKNVTAVTRSSPTTLDVTSAALPAWTIVVAVLLFPIGLLALLAKQTRLLHFHAEPNPDGGTLLHIDGAVTPGVQKRLVEIWHQLFPAESVAASA